MNQQTIDSKCEYAKKWGTMPDTRLYSCLLQYQQCKKQVPYGVEGLMFCQLYLNQNEQNQR